MPIYEFKCRKCDNLFEILFMSSNEKTDASCPSCKSKKVDRQISIFGGKIGNTSGGSGAGCSTCSATTCSTA